jgi:hypothetical protein
MIQANRPRAGTRTGCPSRRSEASERGNCSPTASFTTVPSVLWSLRTTTPSAPVTTAKCRRDSRYIQTAGSHVARSAAPPPRPWSPDRGSRLRSKPSPRPSSAAGRAPLSLQPRRRVRTRAVRTVLAGDSRHRPARTSSEGLTSYLERLTSAGPARCWSSRTRPFRCDSWSKRAGALRRRGCRRWGLSPLRRRHGSRSQQGCPK